MSNLSQTCMRNFMTGRTTVPKGKPFLELKQSLGDHAIFVLFSFPLTGIRHTGDQTAAGTVR